MSFSAATGNSIRDIEEMEARSFASYYRAFAKIHQSRNEQRSKRRRGG